MEHVCKRCDTSCMEIMDTGLLCEEVKPETWEAYVARRRMEVGERIKAELLRSKDAPREKAEGENDYERAKLDVYPRPTT